MSGGKSRHWLVVLGMVLLVIIAGVVIVIGISLAVHGGGMDALIEMTEKAAWGIVGLVGCIVLIFVAGSIASVCGETVDRWRDSRLPDEVRGGSTGSTGSSGSFGVLFLIVMCIFLIAFLAFLGENDQIADLARGASAFAVLIAVCWCCDKVIVRRRKWRESGRQGHWWTQK